MSSLILEAREVFQENEVYLRNRQREWLEGYMDHDQLCNHDVYLITYLLKEYPISRIDDYFGLWKKIIKKENNYLEETSECAIDLKNHKMYFGIAKFDRTKVCNIISYLIEDSDAIIVFSESDMINQVEDIAKVALRNEPCSFYHGGNYFDVANIFNHFCGINGAIVRHRDFSEDDNLVVYINQNSNVSAAKRGLSEVDGNTIN